MSIWLQTCSDCGEVFDFQECPFCRKKRIDKLEVEVKENERRRF